MSTFSHDTSANSSRRWKQYQKDLNNPNIKWVDRRLPKETPKEGMENSDQIPNEEESLKTEVNDTSEPKEVNLN